jgi:uncharacterized Fe-S radical SAM superfamily protein PflX
MIPHSRRSFLTKCLHAAAAAACAPFACALLSGCGERASTESSVPEQSAMNDSDQDFVPNYVRLHQQGELENRAAELWHAMRDCRLCPRLCRIDRIAGECGACGASARLYIASFHPHFGEERGLVGAGGSGTIFLTHCSLRCVFCINWQISQGGEGSGQRTASAAGL